MYTAEGIVLKRSNVGEADRLVTLFTKDHGKVTVRAKGVRKPTSRRAGALEPFTWVRASVASGRGEVDTLAEVQILAIFPAWRKHLGRITLAYQLVEAVDKLTPDHQPHPEIFEILKTSLFEIGRLQVGWKEKIANWLMDIAKELGYWPKNKPFTGDVYHLLETISSRPLNSAKLLSKLKRP